MTGISIIAGFLSKYSDIYTTQNFDAMKTLSKEETNKHENFDLSFVICITFFI
jgi:hypothetical protein